MGFGIGGDLAALMAQGYEKLKTCCAFGFRRERCAGDIPQYEDDRRWHIVYGQSRYEKLPWRKAWVASTRCAVGLRYSPYCEVPQDAKQGSLGGRCESRSNDAYSESVRSRCRTGPYPKECA